MATHPGDPTPEQALDDWASVLTHEALLRESFEREAPGLLTGASLARFLDWNRRRNEEIFAWLDGDRDIQAENRRHAQQMADLQRKTQTATGSQIYTVGTQIKAEQDRHAVVMAALSITPERSAIQSGRL